MPSLVWENRLRVRGHENIAGIDEAGRGPWAGPLVAAAVILPPRFRLSGLDDSKKLTADQRERIFDRLVHHPAVRFHWVAIEASEIDRMGLQRANHDAMRLAFAGLPETAGAALIDGRPVPDFPVPQEAIVEGDSISLSIAAASVIAKVHRDRLMNGASTIFPEYGFEKHKGYGTRFHLQQLRQHGPCPIHRRSFRPVAEVALSFVADRS
ncbi:MAG: ribonuclease HII [Verrucomicrobia bacterium]|nr:ribonuclease HII [Verrucomicrobiota bacterium]